MFILYVDDVCLISPSKSKLHQEIESLKTNCDLANDSDLQDYLVNSFEQHSNGSDTITQPKVIDLVLDIVGINQTNKHVNMYDNPAITP